MKKKFSRIPLVLLILALTSLACNFSARMAGPPLWGTVGGIITADQNGDGVISTDEVALEGVLVTLSGCDNRIAQSDSNGLFEFSDVPAGICVLEVSKDGWEYSAAQPEAGHPIPVTLEEKEIKAMRISMRPVATVAAQTVSADPTATSAPTDIPPTVTPDVTATPSTPMVTPIDQNVNCRFGPSAKYFATDALFVDKTVPILGRTSDSSWWQVDGPRNGYAKCFVAANVTQTSGDLSNVPVVSSPAAFVTAVTAFAKVNKGALCTDPHHIVLDGVITANGPTTVEYRWWFKNLNTGNVEYGNYKTLTFNEYGEKPVHFETDLFVCADVEVQLQVNKPNQIAGKDSFSIKIP